MCVVGIFCEIAENKQHKQIFPLFSFEAVKHVFYPTIKLNIIFEIGNNTEYDTTEIKKILSFFDHFMLSFKDSILSKKFHEKCYHFFLAKLVTFLHIIAQTTYVNKKV